MFDDRLLGPGWGGDISDDEVFFIQEELLKDKKLAYLWGFGSIPVFRFGMLANLLQRIGFYAVVGYIAAYLIDTYGMSVGETAVPLAVVGSGAVAGSLWSGSIASHRNRLNFVAGSALAGGAAATLVFAVDPSIWATVGIAFGAVCLLSIGWPVFITFATDVAGQSRATAIGMIARRAREPISLRHPRSRHRHPGVSGSLDRRRCDRLGDRDRCHRQQSLRHGR